MLKMALAVNLKWWFKGILICVIVALIFLFISWAENSIKGTNELKNMESYLEEKYGKGFVVSNYRIEGRGLGVEGDPVADVYPKDDIDLKFSVRDRGHYVFGDTYAQLYWSKQGSVSLLSTISKEFPKMKVDRISFSVTGGLEQRFATLDDYPYRGYIPNVERVLKEYPDRLIVDLVVNTSDMSTSNEPSDAHLKTAYNVIQFGESLGIAKGKIGYSYTSPSYHVVNDFGNKVSRYSILVGIPDAYKIGDYHLLEKYFTDRAHREE